VSFVAWAALLITPFAIYVLSRRHFGLWALIGVELAPAVVGAFILADSGEAPYVVAWLMFAALSVTFAGYVMTRIGFASKVGRNPREEPAVQGQSLMTRGQARMVAMVAILGSAYHFSRVGIPLLASNVEVARYDFAGSGLFGLPGRLYLFGLPLAAGLVAFESATRRMDWYRDRWTALTLFALLLTRIGSGFKSGLIEFLIYLGAIFLLIKVNPPTTARILGRHSWAIALAVAAVFLVGTTYQTYQASNATLVDLLYARATTGGAVPGVVVLTGSFPNVGQTELGLDLPYFIREYTGQPLFGQYSFSRLISCAMLGISPLSSIPSPPVTIGAFPELTNDFGIYMAFVLMFALGSLMAYLEVSAKWRRHPWARFCRLVVVLAVLDYMSKGGLVYTVLNWGAIALFLALVGWACTFVSGPRWRVGQPNAGLRRR